MRFQRGFDTVNLHRPTMPSAQSRPVPTPGSHAKWALDVAVGRIPIKEGHSHLCFFTTFIEPQGTHMMSINQSPLRFQVAFVAT
jgi:hypothetical protein